MKVDLYEKIWMWAVGVMLTAFFAATAWSAVARGIHPPSHLETIDPATALSDSRFARQGPWVDGDGQLHVTVLGLMYAWLPAQMTLPADTPITFHITSRDVVHGYQIIRTNGQAMAVPGYVSQFTTTLSSPGEYLIACNEYCGIGHHMMSARLTVVPASAYTMPAPGEDPFKAHAAAMGGHDD
jgi:cytochrome c oxidase subunit 2